MDNKKILIVDDEPDILRTLEKRLSSAGYSVFKALNGKDAIALARSQRPNLIVLDVLMPNMDGGQTAAELRNFPETKDIPIIFLTCLITKDEEPKKPGAVGEYFIAKPYNPEELLKEINKHIQG